MLLKFLVITLPISSALQLINGENNLYPTYILISPIAHHLSHLLINYISNMKGLLLCGGFGTRLRPLTLSIPKPLVEFCNKCILWHQTKAMVSAGVTEIILAINYKPECIQSYLQELEKEFKVLFYISKEETPMGTAGPIRLAESELMKGDCEDFFVFNSDIICDYPLVEMLAMHKAAKKQGTLVVVEVPDPSRYGSIIINEKNEIMQFIEKSKVIVSTKINAGLYLLNRKMISMIPKKNTSIEREIFPDMAKNSNLMAYLHKGYWLDIGQPKDFIIATEMFLKHANKLYIQPNTKGNVLVDESAKVDSTAVLGPNVVIGPKCVIEAGVRIENSTILAGTVVGAHTMIKGSIIGWGNVIGKWVRIDGLTVTGEAVEIKDEIYINGAMILPQKAISENVKEEGKVLL